MPDLDPEFVPKRGGPSAPARTAVWLMTPGEVMASAGLSRTGLFAMTKTGEFPAPVFVGNQRRWRSDVVQAWIETRPPEPYHLVANERPRENEA